MATDLFGPTVAALGVTSRPAETRLFSALDTFFRDCTDDDTDDGTEAQAALFNQWLAMMRAIARGNGQTALAADIVDESNVDDLILLKSIQHLIQRGIPAYGDDESVTPNLITISLSPALKEYKRGFRVWTKIANANTAAAVNVNISALGNKALKTVNGADPGIGACPLGGMMCFEYDGTNFQIVSVLGAAAFSLPKATITTAAIGSLAFGTATTHGMSVASSNDMGAGPTISGGNAVVLPAGTYLFTIKSQVTINNVNNTTQIAGHTLITKNGVEQQRATEATHLLAGQNVTVFPGFSGSISVNGTDTISIQEIGGATVAGDYSGGSSGAGSVSFYRVGA